MVTEGDIEFFRITMAILFSLVVYIIWDFIIKPRFSEFSKKIFLGFLVSFFYGIIS
jgi:hypothetical protein